ncbi:MAG: Fe-S cluster assembly ATPase SufC [Euryarchaeota archaeon]|jgi:Fe-S cluster assembly ATP-binding protein|nr:Fe-S cluster assembly ATPase SufC [Euryarchaeota archaeon]MBT4982139.1 Fe-S cluster assembly ATPase SufC [Euryarchaeota archaeon]MBT5184260.1 Fe-S cluster assembly ATPase SufC [Euryarchaeota archaeon]
MGDEVLSIDGLHVSVDGTEIIKGLSLTINIGEIHAIMGRNGAGKSTLANVVMGHPAYEITAGTIAFKGVDLDEMEVFERARAGMFLSFQYPASIPGVQVGTFLRKSVSSVRGNSAPSARDFRKELMGHMDSLNMDKSFLSRYVNDGFSGGEKKRLEILQMLLLNPSLALLDETDSGLDIDALRVVADGINSIAPEAGCLLITHYQRLLEHVKPDFVHVMIDGRIVRTGSAELAGELEAKGYDWLEA